MMIRSSIGEPSFSLSLLAFSRGREDGNPFSGAGWTPSGTLVSKILTRAPGTRSAIRNAGHTPRR